MRHGKTTPPAIPSSFPTIRCHRRIVGMRNEIVGLCRPRIKWRRPMDLVLEDGQLPFVMQVLGFGACVYFRTAHRAALRRLVAMESPC